MRLEARADRLQWDRRDVSDPEDRVRVAHVDDARRTVVGQAGRRRTTRRVRHRRALPAGSRPRPSAGAHVDAIGPFAEPLADDDARRGLDREGARPARPRQPVSDAARAVAAGAGLAAVVVEDADERFRVRRPGVGERHELVVVEPRRAVDRPRFGRRRQVRSPTQIEGQDLVADAVHPRHAASGERARGGRFRQVGSRRSRRASLSMARAPSRATAARSSSSAIGAASAAARWLAAWLGAGGARRR